MTVARIAEKPRVSHPFSEAAWAALDALGEKVDAELARNDVRLTMGGEPTFVAIDDYQSAEWNTAALGPTKRTRADELIRRCGSASRREDCCTTAWANGIPARPCRGGPSVFIGGATGSRFGMTRRALRPRPPPRGRVPRMRSDSPRRWQAASGSIARTLRPAFEDPAERMLEQGEPATPAGYVLPVQHWAAKASRAG